MASGWPMTRLPYAIFHREQFVHFPFQHLGNRNPRPLGHHFGHVFRSNFFFEQAAVFLDLAKSFVFLFDVLFQGDDDAVLQLRGLAQVAFALGLGSIGLCSLKSLLEFPDCGDDLLLLVPLLLEEIRFVFETLHLPIAPFPVVPCWQDRTLW